MLNILQCTEQSSTTKNDLVHNVDSTTVDTSILEDSTHSELYNLLRLFCVHRECSLGQEDEALTSYDCRLFFSLPGIK